MKNTVMLIAFVLIGFSQTGFTAQLIPVGGFCPALFETTETSVDSSQVEEWMFTGQRVKVTVERTIFLRNVRESIKNRITYQNEKSLSELKEQVAVAYDAAHSAMHSGSSANASGKAAVYRALNSTLDSRIEILKESLPGVINRELVIGSYETLQAELGADVRFFEVTGVISPGSYLMLRIANEKTGQRLKRPVPVVESILFIMGDGQAAVIPAKNIQSIQPIP